MTNTVITDAQRLKENSGLTGRLLIDGLDHAVRLQTSGVEGYIARMRRGNPQATPNDIQRELDTQFKRLATGSGGAAGLAAAVPGVGFVTGTAAVGAESLVFLDAAALYTTASAHLRGVDIRDPERRRALILAVILGAPGTALVDTLIGDPASADSAEQGGLAKRLNRLNIPTLNTINTQLMKMAKSRLTKKVRNMWIGKLLPLGVGLVLGTMANRKLADQVIENTRKSLGPIPAQFDSPAPEKPAHKRGLFRR